MAFQYGYEEVCDEFEASFLRLEGDPLLQSEGERKVHSEAQMVAIPYHSSTAS